MAQGLAGSRPLVKSQNENASVRCAIMRILCDQDLSAQLEALKAAGADVIYREKVSARRRSRPELAKLMRALQPGDRVVVTKIDRLGRSTRELLELMVRPTPSSSR